MSAVQSATRPANATRNASVTRPVSASVRTPARREKIFKTQAIDGGLNLRDAEINLKDNESPEIVNL